MAIKFPLILKEQVAVRNIDELRQHFDMRKIWEYYTDGKFEIWLEQRGYDEELAKISSLKNLPEKEIAVSICEIIEVPNEGLNSIDVGELTLEYEKRSVVKQYTDDEKILNNLEKVATSQNELEVILDNKCKEKCDIYLCGEEFIVTDKYINVNYIGITMSIVKLNIEDKCNFLKHKITFKNVKLNSAKAIKVKFGKNVNVIIEKNIKRMVNGYNKTFASAKYSHAVIDKQGEVYMFGLLANGQNHVPSFTAPIVDIDITFPYVAAVDKNGKVYQWGDLPYNFPSVPPQDLPKIKQIACDYNFIIALDEEGKLHWWGGYKSNKIFQGSHNAYDKSIIENISMPKELPRIIQIRALGDVVIALGDDKKVYMWGNNNVPEMFDIPKDLPPIEMIALGSDFALALDDNGKIHAWGKNNESNCDIPKDLPFITYINSNSSECVAIDEDGKVHYWGYLNNGTYDYMKSFPPMRYVWINGPTQCSSSTRMHGIDENGKVYGEYLPDDIPLIKLPDEIEEEKGDTRNA